MPFQKKSEALGILITVVVLLLGGLLVYQDIQRALLQQSIADKILRFHVRANSDSPQDQELKLMVRDAVGGYLNKKLEDSGDLEDSLRIVRKELPQIEQIAEHTLRAHGSRDPVTARIEEVVFPQKTYGEYSFPDGVYQALDLMIGKGEGHNWWCVLYPNMCFHGSVYEVVDAEAEDSLRRVLAPEEYDAVLKSGKYRIRFRYLKFLNRG